MSPLTYLLHPLLLLLSLAPTSAQLQPAQLQRFQSFGFGMVSYYDAVTDSEAQKELIHFVKTYNITFVNQYVCSVTTSTDYAQFVDNIYNATGAHVNLLFDDTLVEHSMNSTCDIPCIPNSSTGPGTFFFIIFFKNCCIFCFDNQ